MAAAGIHPGMYSAENIQGQIDAEVLLSVTPPPQMPATLEAGTIYGYCVGEPWNQQAVSQRNWSSSNNKLRHLEEQPRESICND